MRVSSRRVAVVCLAVLASACSAAEGQPREGDEPAAGSGGSESGRGGANNDVGEAGGAGSVFGSGGGGGTVSGAGGTGAMKSQAIGGMGGSKAGGAGSSGSGGAPVMGGKAGKCDMHAVDGGAPAVTPPGLRSGVWKNITPAALDMTATWGTTGITVDP